MVPVRLKRFCLHISRGPAKAPQYRNKANYCGLDWSPFLAGFPEDLDENGGDKNPHRLKKVAQDVYQGSSNIDVSAWK